MSPVIQILSVALVLTLPYAILHAEETPSQKATIQVEKAGNSVKRGYRKADEKVCEMLNGKLKCVAKKVKHAVQNAGDAASTGAKELQNKVAPGK